AIGALTTIPRVDTASAGVGSLRRVERLVFEFSVDSGPVQQAIRSASWLHLRP
ncbi:MAG: hypothetical protein IT360_03380, partial [Gemmatimonadaceae bacterium]|nr:hypothetical protein [Gemmatimonadaceae bacterium]